MRIWNAICFILICLILGFLVGRWDTNNRLPNCEEDEYLYPVDYTGRGNNVTDDYVCIPIDDIRAN